MNTRRTKMLIVVTTAALVVSFIIRWDDIAIDFLSGWKDAQAQYSKH